VFTIAEEVGQGASSILTPAVASMVTVDNGTTAPGQNSDEFGVTIGMADQTGPFDYHLTKRTGRALPRTEDIRFQKDIFRHYRSDSASAVNAGFDVSTALITFGVDASHGYERIHLHALRSLAELVTAYVTSEVEIGRDAAEIADMSGFPTQPMDTAEEQQDAGIAEAGIERTEAGNPSRIVARRGDGRGHRPHRDIQSEDQRPRHPEVRRGAGRRARKAEAA
jgi:hypothetical protein